MRVIAGTAKGRRLRSPRGQIVRPTSDRVKEALFSILGSRVDLAGARVLDLFAGTGSVGIEALSRNAASAVFVEQRAPVRRILHANLAECGFSDRARVLSLPVARAVLVLAQGRERFDVIFIDPPYGRGLAAATLTQLANVEMFAAGAWVMVESHADDALAPRYGVLRLTHTRYYGKSCLSLFCAMDSKDCVPPTA